MWCYVLCCDVGCVLWGDVGWLRGDCRTIVKGSAALYMVRFFVLCCCAVLRFAYDGLFLLYNYYNVRKQT